MSQSWGSRTFDKGDRLNQSDIHKSIGQDVINNMGLRELVSLQVQSLSSFRGRSNQSRFPMAEKGQSHKCVLEENQEREAFLRRQDPER